MNDPESQPLDAVIVTIANRILVAPPENRPTFRQVDSFVRHANRNHRFMNVSLTS
jgi:hypothetical protein